MLLNALVSMVGLVGGFLFGVYMQNVSAGAYLATLTLRHRACPKSSSRRSRPLAFGLIAGLVGCYRGLTVSGGSKGLGTAVNETVVLCVVALFAVNVVLTTIGVRFGTGTLTCRPLRYCAPASRGRPTTFANTASAATKPLDEVGQIGWFAVIGVRDMAWALTRYRKEMLRLIAEIGMGTGAMAVIGGTAAIIGFVTLSAGSLVAIQGFASLGNIGVEALLGFFAALINVRLAAPDRHRHRAGRHGRRRRHRRARRHAHQRGDRRARGDGHQVDRVPGVDPHHGRAGRHHPAVLDRP